MREDWAPPPGADPAYDPAPRGRVRRGLWLARKSWSLLSQRRALWALPVLSAAAVTVAAVALFVPAALAIDPDSVSEPVIAVALVAAIVVLTFVSTFFNVAFLVMVNAHIEGEELSVGQALGAAAGRIGPIAAWSLLTTIVGLIFRALEEVPGGELLARLVGALGGLVWSLATFFVVPVLAVEGVGPLEAIRRSAGAFKKRWGEQVTGDVVISGLVMLGVFASMMLLVAGAAVASAVPVLGAAIMVLAALGLVVVLVASSAISRVFSLVVYRHAEGRPLPTPFTPADVELAFKPRRSAFRRLLGG